MQQLFSEINYIGILVLWFLREENKIMWDLWLGSFLPKTNIKIIEAEKRNTDIAQLPQCVEEGEIRVLRFRVLLMLEQSSGKEEVTRIKELRTLMEVHLSFCWAIGYRYIGVKLHRGWQRMVWKLYEKQLSELIQDGEMFKLWSASVETPKWSWVS